MEDNERGYVSVTLKELLPRVDELSKDMGNDNRSGTIRIIVKKYFDLKDAGLDILKLDKDEILKR